MVQPRMWCVPPEMLCNKHLLQEHNDMHRAVAALIRGQVMSNRQVHAPLIKTRHDHLAQEMMRRGLKHVGGLPVLPRPLYAIKLELDPGANLEELKSTCTSCFSNWLVQHQSWLEKR